MLFPPLSDQFDSLTGAHRSISAQQGKLNAKPCRFVLKKELYPRVYLDTYLFYYIKSRAQMDVARWHA